MGQQPLRPLTATMASKLAPFIFRTVARPARIASRTQCRSFTATPRVASDALHVHRDTPVNNASIPFKFTEQNNKLVDEILKRYPPNTRRRLLCPFSISDKDNMGSAA